MKEEKLFELLTLVGGVRSTKWETVRQLVDIIKKDNKIVEDKKWYDKWKQDHPEYYPLNLSDINTWSTYDDTCIDLNFSNKNNKIKCHAKIYDGDNIYGGRKKLRFETHLLLPTDSIHTIEQRIMWKFEDYLENSYEEYLENKKKLWINNMKDDILNGRWGLLPSEIG